MSSKINDIGLGNYGNVQKSENNKNDGFHGFPNMNPKSYSSKIKQNNSTEVLGCSFNNLYNKNAPPDPLDPKSTIFPGSPRQVPESSYLFVLH